MPEGYEFTLNWNVTETEIYVRLEAPTDGWVGLGIGEDGGGAMPGGDFVICTAEGWVSDRYALAYTTPTEDGSQDWTLHASGATGGGSTWCVLSRALVTNDNQDRELSHERLRSGAIPLMMAYGPDDAFGYHGRSSRTTAQVRMLEAQDRMASLLAMPDYDANHTYFNGNFGIPHDWASCARHNARVGSVECFSPTTTCEDLDPQTANLDTPLRTCIHL